MDKEKKKGSKFCNMAGWIVSVSALAVLLAACSGSTDKAVKDTASVEYSTDGQGMTENGGSTESTDMTQTGYIEETTGSSVQESTNVSDSSVQESTNVSDNSVQESIVELDLSIQEKSDVAAYLDTLYPVDGGDSIISLYVDDNGNLRVWYGNTATEEEYYSRTYESYSVENDTVYGRMGAETDEFVFMEGGHVDVLLTGYGSTHYQSYMREKEYFGG